MAVLQMQKISICALKKDRKAVLEKLQRMKVMEISQILEEDPDFTTMDTRQERMELEKSASLSDQHHCMCRTAIIHRYMKIHPRSQTFHTVLQL